MRFHTIRSLAASALAAFSLTGCGGGASEPTPPSGPTLASLTVALAATTIRAGQTTTAVASGVDQNGSPIALGAVQWATSAGSVASVSASGVVTGVAAGQATITATSAGKVGTATLIVDFPTPTDYAIADAQFTQGVQVADGSIPMVLGGNAAAVNVLVRANNLFTTPPMQVVLRLFDASGALVRTDTALTRGNLGSSPSYTSPSAQILLPASALKSGMRWQVVRDPRHVVPDDSIGSDVFPRAGTTPLATVTVPALNIRFVPILLASHNNATGSVTSQNLSQYLQTLTSVHPLGAVSAHVGPVLATQANFGTAPSGGAAPFWQQVIAELDLARIADPVEPTINWYGVVVPPAGFNNTSYGGFSYIPTSGTNTGAGTRTSASVQVNWFFNPTQARDLVAHEMGHTFGRLHAPCGGAGSPLDPNYPVAGGTLEQAGHDAAAWGNGLSSIASTIPASTGDVMGYCFPVWSSAYTYRGVMAFRGTTVVASRVPEQEPERAQRVLVVRGAVTNGRTITLEPTFALDARVTRHSPGDYSLQGLDGAGAILFSTTFDPFTLDHDPTVRPFTITVPVSADIEARLATVVVRGRAGARRLDRAPPPAVNALALREPLLERRTNGLVTASCSASSNRGILVLDAATGSVLGSAAQPSMQFAAPSAATVSIICSDGVRTTNVRAVVP